MRAGGDDRMGGSRAHRCCGGWGRVAVAHMHTCAHRWRYEARDWSVGEAKLTEAVGSGSEESVRRAAMPGGSGWDARARVRHVIVKGVGRVPCRRPLCGP